MKWPTREQWLGFAEVGDALRIFPRVMLMFYCYFVYHVTTNILTWYEALPKDARSLEASGLGAAVITAVTGLGTWFLQIYHTTGRDWQQPNGDSK